jgi:hypothetical protein
MHYQDLIESAERSLTLAEGATAGEHQTAGSTMDNARANSDDNPWAESRYVALKDPSSEEFSEEPPF